MVGEMFNISILKWSKLLLESPPWLEKFSKITTQMAKIALKLSFTYIFFFSFFLLYPPSPSRENPDNFGEEKSKYQYILSVHPKNLGFLQYILQYISHQYKKYISVHISTSGHPDLVSLGLTVSLKFLGNHHHILTVICSKTNCLIPLKVSPWLKKILNFDGPISPRMKDFNNFFTEYLLHNSRKSNRSKKVRKRSTTERKEHKGAYFSVISKKVRKGWKGASLGPLLSLKAA